MRIRFKLSEKRRSILTIVIMAVGGVMAVVCSPIAAAIGFAMTMAGFLKIVRNEAAKSDADPRPD